MQNYCTPKVNELVVIKGLPRLKGRVGRVYSVEQTDSGPVYLVQVACVLFPLKPDQIAPVKKAVS